VTDDQRCLGVGPSRVERELWLDLQILRCRFAYLERERNSLAHEVRVSVEQALAAGFNSREIAETLSINPAFLDNLLR